MTIAYKLMMLIHHIASRQKIIAKGEMTTNHAIMAHRWKRLRILPQFTSETLDRGTCTER